MVLIIAFSNPEMKNAWEAISKLSLPWIGGLLLCWFVYVLFEAMGTWICLRRRGYDISLFRVLGTGLIGMYYSNITPGASGGQPMQVNSLRKAGIPIEYGSMALTVRLVMNQFSVCAIGLVLFLINRDFVYKQLGGAIWAARVGWLINFAAVPLVLLAAFKRNWVQKLAEMMIRFLEKIHLVRNMEAAVSKVTEVLDTYHTALLDLMHSPGQILLQFACSTIGLLALFGTTVFVYYAFGMSGTPWYHVLTISCLLFVSASYTPLPGASGAQEGGFLLYFRDIFKNGTIGLALLIWRFFTYYLYLIVGVFTILLEKIILRREARKREKTTGNT
jgi:uncharacterized protein (TIRG00374 family)